MARRSNGDAAIIIALVALAGGMLVGFYKYPIPTAVGVFVIGIALFPDNADAVATVAIIGGGIGWLIKKSETTFVVQANQKQIESKYGQRTVDHGLSLIERNKDIIEKNLQGMYHDSFRYYVENKIRDCISDIATAEGKSQLAPKHEYLSTWSNTSGIPKEYLELKDYLEPRFKARFSELEEEERKRREEMNRRLQKSIEDKGRKLAEKHSVLIDKFFVVAERRVSALDEYGDENWEGLYEEIAKVMNKIKGDGEYTKKFVSESLTGRRGLIESYFMRDDEYAWLIKELESRFKQYHKQNKFTGIKPDFDAMNGIEFENYLFKVFKEGGYEVAGTNTTGDQGADVIAKKNGRTLIIQAKRYTGNVGNKAVQEIIAALQFYGGDEGWVITNSKFTPAAKVLAQKSRVILIEGHDLMKLSEKI